VSETTPAPGADKPNTKENPAQNGAGGEGAPAAEAKASHESSEAGDPAQPEAKASEAPAAKLSDKPKRPPLIPKGNPLRLARGGIPLIGGSFVALLLMAHTGQLRWGVPLGAIFVAIATWGAMDLLGTFDDPEDRVVKSTMLADLRNPLLGLAGSWLFFCLMLGLASRGRILPQLGWGILVTLSWVLLTAAVYGVGRALGVFGKDEDGVERTLLQRHGFWVVVAGAVLLFPCMGSYSLWDPWETHYGEVSREILAKDDWISLWWAQDGWFWSKPVADMWMQAISMATLGIHYEPDKMLIGDGQVPTWHPEWAVRAPVVMLTILALYVLYKGVAKTFGRRAALIGALVLATMPDWYFIAHQTMTDMPFVGAMTASIGLVMLGLRTPEDQLLRAYEVKLASRTYRLTAWHLVFGAILMCGLPQILYLFSRNVEFLFRPGSYGFRWHWDEFRSGSGGGNCGLPGNEDCHLTNPASIPHGVAVQPEGFVPSLERLFGSFEPVIQGLFWVAVFCGALYLSWGERRTKRLYYLAGWFFAAISTLAKGPAGVGLPVLVTLTYLASARPAEQLVDRMTRVIRELQQFEIVAGLLLIFAVAMPWYVAMYMRHGPPFTDRLIFHDMFNRAFSHVHDTNEGDDTSFRFYVWQLGYALFPWSGLAPIGLMWWMRGGKESDGDKTDASVMLCMWFVFAFSLFSFMGTKFHHYIFPAVPPVAMLIGVVLSDMLGPGEDDPRMRKPLFAIATAAGLTLTVLGISRLEPGSFLGTKPDGQVPNPSIPLGVTLLVVGLGILGWLFMQVRAGAKKEAASSEAAASESDDSAPHLSRMLAGGAVGSALLLVLVTRDLAFKPDNADQPGAIRFLQLFTYNYRRAWPDSLDFSAPLMAFGVVAGVLSLALAVRAARRFAVPAVVAFGVVWAIWGLDVYMEKTGAHWGQHEVIAAYYSDRSSPSDILVAYQMNWKGENFYTGNRVPAFVSTGSTFTTWLKKKRDEGVKVMYFITEHGRIGGLKGEVAAKNYREVTDKNLCNKFVLVRAEL
jgi:4-amino-4-deoxy-L-arabinose transferase-like glycosyltransferase